MPDANRLDAWQAAAAPVDNGETAAPRRDQRAALIRRTGPARWLAPMAVLVVAACAAPLEASRPRAIIDGVERGALPAHHVGAPFLVETGWYGRCKRFPFDRGSVEIARCHIEPHRATIRCDGVPCTARVVPDVPPTTFEIVPLAPGRLDLVVSFEPIPRALWRTVRRRVEVVP